MLQISGFFSTFWNYNSLTAQMCKLCIAEIRNSYPQELYKMTFDPLCSKEVKTVGSKLATITDWKYCL